ncbi:MAG: PilZ domain-containing protein [Chloroflexota bacterium]|nr:PilZ domain-containing protein [Dehalococcoidia bacterium]MDW8254886.1 PilZ domain-containing protein [Chloroflexota bacterium]
MMPDLSFLAPGQAARLRWTAGQGPEHTLRVRIAAVQRTHVVVTPIASGPSPRLGQTLDLEVGLPTGFFVLRSEVIGHTVGASDLVLEVARVERIQRRAFVRAPVDLNTMPAYLLGADGEPTTRFAVRLLDLSGGGVGFECLEPLLPGQLFTIVLQLDGSSPIRPVVRVLEVSARERGDPAIRRVRAVFEAIAERDRQRIIQFVYRLLADERRRNND